MNKQADFFNTINICGWELHNTIRGIKKQNDRILEIMKQANEPMTPLQVSRVYNGLYPEAPHTSIRRAITTMTTKGLLRQLNKQKIEQYGAKNYYWEVVK